MVTTGGKCDVKKAQWTVRSSQTVSLRDGQERNVYSDTHIYAESSWESIGVIIIE